MARIQSKARCTILFGTVVTEITDRNFEQEVLKSSIPVVMDMWASWYGPCRVLGPVVEKLAEDFKGLEMERDSDKRNHTGDSLCCTW